MKRFYSLCAVALLLLAGLVSNVRADRIGGPLATAVESV
jgi:hypothetical protein